MDSVIKWLTLAANLGVIGGIIFLAIETQQNNEQLDSQARLLRTESNTQNFFLSATSPEIAAAFIKIQENEELSPIEYFQLRSFSSAIFQQCLGQYEEVIRDRLEAETVIRGYRFLMQNNPIFHEFWEFNKPRYPENFVIWFEDNILNP